MRGPFRQSALSRLAGPWKAAVFIVYGFSGKLESLACGIQEGRLCEVRHAPHVG